MEIIGKHNRAKVFNERMDDMTRAQLQTLVDQPFTEGATIRIMPDMHAGKGSVVGTTMTIHDKIVPNLVGVDLGCGMLCTEIKAKRIDFQKLDDVIRQAVPSGMNIREEAHAYAAKLPLEDVRAPFKLDRALRSVGTLGSGNHFIEVNENNGRTYLVIHSGSRHLGVQIADHYQSRAIEHMMKTTDVMEAIEQLKATGREHEISTYLETERETRKQFRDLAYVEGDAMQDYMHDVRIAQQYAAMNRLAMTDVIVEAMNWSVLDQFDTVHNYIDHDDRILRKGAISAKDGERVIIPMNMRDGSLICTGKGNPDWNFSGPHGAGRIMSRSAARKRVDFNEFKRAMSGVWSTSVRPSTIDESPFVYKSMKEIVRYIEPAVTIDQVIKPLYNFKAN
ncbi:MAG: RNA-splicing ligase RtcB [Exiguobacterium sp.]|uniref:3'-phosphate/5'-hydroxy nucleic acid ligase n=1 Tax=Exiguobacterium alkaliphilum TaxID=1428684 RepID=A0ABT2KY14_9BACL|nr:RNA-splicing ligase RtcB [Exiguobacterium alkaliphilum]MDX5323810.1 RNA-splicing ligase RtcB [Exiguobacterium sp.]MCT4795814.1 RNA-splicing ligase RtcB [Exiguobacterium alkaliphilum]MDX5425625.1 RNA-splicing ligase RtcB [Exiguobacterium sp.]MDX6773028.1 RNA-splicing ligase RtcB [Exiguobacterium sp.]QUE86112.1 RNA-splicing ligase RtcB [Exiguobacterium alkaliphilum]